MKKKFLIIFVTIFSAFAVSCSDDDDPVVEQTPKLEGTWQLTNIDFSIFEETGMPASDACVVEMIAGYDFREDKRFYFVLGEGGFFDPYEEDYWTWTGTINDFKIVQVNPSNPPYNFSLEPTNIAIGAHNDTWKMTFTAELFNGSVADFTLIKQDLDLTQRPVMTKPDGTVYECGFFD